MIQKLFRFAISGLSAAIVNLALFYALERMLHISYGFAVIVSTACAASYHFLIQKRWVFRAGDTGAAKTEGYLFFAASVVNLILNEILLVVFISVMHMDSFLSQFISLGILACMNYFLYEHIIFRKKHAAINQLHAVLDRVRLRHVLAVAAAVIWLVLHWWGISYGTQSIPLHQSYVGDEQAPVNGALHILNDKSLLAVHNLKTLYYGPVFAVIALPAVAGDFLWKYISGDIHSPEAYKQSILWDWGGIIFNIRVLAVAASLSGILAAFMLARTRLFNPSGNAFLPYLTAMLIGIDFFYFEYSHFFKHWIFIVALFLIQLLVMAKLFESDNSKVRRKWWIFHACIIALSFGISYSSLFFQLAWLGFLIHWLKNKNIGMIKEWLLSMCAALAGVLIMFWWHPYALLRIFKGGATIPFGEEMLGFAYFGTLILLNHSGLFIALALMFFIGIKRKLFSASSWAFMAGLIAVALFQYVLFSAQPGLNREGRYMLPSIVCLLLLCAHIWGLYFSDVNRKRAFDWIIVSCIIFNLVFHAVHMGRWIYVYAQGPVEQQMLRELKENSNKTEKILLVQYYIAGSPHTNEAYRDYMNRFGRSEVNLFKELLVSNPRNEAERINAYYIRPDKFKADDMQTFDRVIYLSEPRHEINQFDYFDENIIRLWWHTDLLPRYIIIK